MLTDDERVCLEDLGWDTGYAHAFSAINLPRERARAACRSLAAKGLAVYCRGLMDDDGRPAGSGYAPTSLGVEIGKALDAFAWRPFCVCRVHSTEPIWHDPLDALRQVLKTPPHHAHASSPSAAPPNSAPAIHSRTT